MRPGLDYSNEASNFEEVWPRGWPSMGET